MSLEDWRRKYFENSWRPFSVIEVNGRRRVRSTKLYMVWTSMKSRCNNENHHAYPRYGARGITVCSEWTEYAPFRAWAVKHGYRKGLYLDRINNDGNYSPDNCRWVTTRESMRNTSKVKLSIEMARAIRAAEGSQSAIAAMFGISREQTRDIRNGKSWREA